MKTALVTGANRGLGLEVCKQLANIGFQVILTSRDTNKGHEAIKKLNGLSPNILYHPLDVTSAKSIRVLYQFIKHEIGRLDVLINNAAINYDTWQTTVDANLEEVHQTFETNFFAPWVMMHSFIPLMMKNSYGRIVNVSSGAGSFHEMQGGTPGYGLSKVALNALTLKIARELEGTGILVNAVCPGWVRTEMGGIKAPRSPAEGAEGIVWAAKLPDNSYTGQFFRDKTQIKW